ncbi:MAG: thioredoxin domain-containing protein [Candidatus Korobacteraceae bacterium]
MLRRLVFVLALLLLCLGCSGRRSAQAPAPAPDPKGEWRANQAEIPTPASDLNRRIERTVRAEFKVPGYVQLSVSAPKASEFTNYDSVTVTFAVADKRQTRDFLLSKDGKQLLSVEKMDLTADPYEKVMSKIDLGGRPLRGNKDAKVTIVVYDDYECPFCSRMHQTLFGEIMPAYGDRVKVYYKDFPLFQIHPWAGRAAINSNCLARQSGEAFWDFADYLHTRGEEVSGKRAERRPLKEQDAALDRITLEIGKKRNLDAALLQQCIKDQPSQALEKSVREGESLGVSGTPALFINGSKVEGAVPAEELRVTLDQVLRDAGQQPPATASAASAGDKQPEHK